MTDWVAVGVRVRERREALGETQRQLGARSTVDATGNRIARLEGGEPLGEDKLARVAAALGVTMAFLRYGVASSADVESAKASAYAAGFRAALSAVQEAVVSLAPPLPADAPIFIAPDESFQVGGEPEQPPVRQPGQRRKANGGR